MFNQIIYFIVALLLFSIRQPGTEALEAPFRTLSLAVWLFGIFVAICYVAFLPLKRAIAEQRDVRYVTLRLHSVQNRLCILALGFLALDVYVAHVKSYLQWAPWLESSMTISGGAGLALYLLHLAVVRFWSYPIHRWVHRSSLPRWTFLKEYLLFDCAILAPWLLISLFTDLAQVLGLFSLVKGPVGEISFLGVVLALFIFLGPWMIVRLWRCEPLPPGPVRSQLDEFCRSHRFKMGNFLLWPLFGGEMLTAAVVGVLPRLRYILMTRGILRILGVEELKAVVGHEMGHVRRFHLPFYLVLFLCYSLVAYSFHDIIFVLLLKQDTVLNWALSKDSTELTLFSVIYSLPILALIVVYFRFVFGFFMRNCERQADLYAFQLLGHPFTLISSLQKIAAYSGQIHDLPSWHHFSIRQRVDFLLDCHDNPHHARRHNRKLYGSAAGFLGVVVALSLAGSYLQETETVRTWERQVQLRILEREMEGSPEKAELYSAYGGILLEQKHYEEAEAFLKKALALAPRNASTKNNLAWLYATSPPPHSDPQKALKLAREAAELEAAPHILDTLAEAHYVNGQYEEALRAIGRALARNPENRSYYLEQKEKFERALKGAKS